MSTETSNSIGETGSGASGSRLPAGNSKPTSPDEIRRKTDQLLWHQDRLGKELKQADQKIAAIQEFLGIADQVTEALDSLSQKLFEEVLGMLRDKLTIAIQEVLEQPIKFKADASFKRGAASVDFSIERDGYQEDVRLGQGGSVQNVLSVGLRLFALARLDSDEHRRFLVLDEQDCWLRPELVPKLVNIVYRAATELNFQVIMISHHDVRLFENYADKIYRFDPVDGAVTVEQVGQPPNVSDSD
jgi:ABC-type glutathione transport system ATPase component